VSGLALAAVAALAALSCRRAPVARVDAGGDVGAPSVGDAGHADVVVVEVPALDGGTDGASDGGDSGGDGGDAIDDRGDATVGICPAGIAPLDVCECGCCGGVAETRRCYYPSLGETRDSIPNPMPTPSECSTNGCTEGTRHICCADPGRDAAKPTICAIDTSIEDLSRFTITRRDGDLCTTLEVGSATPVLPITGPPGQAKTNAWRAPCDGSKPPAYAIGGQGEVTPGTLLPSPRYDVHVVLFFDAGTGIADAVRIDKDEVGVAPRCTGDACPPCGGTCQLDATYRFTTTGGLALYRDQPVLAPPATFTYYRRGEAVAMPEKSCAPAFPACGGPAIDVADVMAAFSDPDVRDAFALSRTAGTIPFYGDDQRGGDGPASVILRDEGGSFLIGAPCPAAPTRPCMPIPPGLTRLLGMLQLLNQQQLGDPSCAALGP
jgi:hypothetical protein